MGALADAIDTFPTSFGGRLSLLGSIMAATPWQPEAPAGDGEEEEEAAGRGRGGGPAAAHGGGCASALAAGRAGGAAFGVAGRLQQHAAAAYARLLLQNKLKLQAVLGTVGACLATGRPAHTGRPSAAPSATSPGGGGSRGGGGGSTSASTRVAAILLHALRQLLGSASGPKERARLAMDLFQQTPAHCRGALAEVGGVG